GVRDTEVLQPLDAVSRERLRRSRVERERLAFAPVLTTEGVDAVDHRDEIVERAAGSHPTVPDAGGATEVGVGVSADEHRDRLGGDGLHLDGGEVVELAVVLEVAAAGEAAHDLDALVESAAAPFPGQLHDLVVVGPGAGAD